MLSTVERYSNLNITSVANSHPTISFGTGGLNYVLLQRVLPLPPFFDFPGEHDGKMSATAGRELQVVGRNLPPPLYRWVGGGANKLTYPKTARSSQTEEHVEVAK